MPIDTPPSPALAVAAAERAVEEAWKEECEDAGEAYDPHLGDLGHAMDDLLAARRAAQAAGYVECWVSREAVAALQRARAADPARWDLDRQATALLARDLAALLKGLR